MKSKGSIIGGLLAIFLLALIAGQSQAQGWLLPQPRQTSQAAAAAEVSAALSASLGTAFTYQGQLKSGGTPVSGACDFQFSLWNAGSGGAQIGTTQPRTNVPVGDGLFTVQLDFGSNPFQGEARWLAIELRCPAGSGGYVSLSPRQELTATPYALSLLPGAVIVGSSGTVLLSLTGGSIGLDAESSLFGVQGRSASATGRGVVGLATAGSGPAIGVYGESASAEGYGVYGLASANSTTNFGVYGESNSAYGAGVYGNGPSFGVAGHASSSDDNNYGAWGHSDSILGHGVLGWVSASSGTNYGVYAGTNSPDGYGGYFSSKVHVSGDFSASGSKAFKIDHPLDPANGYLYHFAQEGPEVQNVYNGVITLDGYGQAIVSLPDYFFALNTGPFRYQLTPIGAPMPELHIAAEIQEYTFAIAGGVPGRKVSWEVTAIRNDPYLRDHPALAEQAKPASERGTYLYPEGYGLPQEMGLDYQHRAEMLEHMPEAPSSVGSE